MAPPASPSTLRTVAPPLTRTGLAVLLSLLVIGGTLRLWRLHDPFRGFHDSASAMLGSALVAQWRYGPAQARFAAARTCGDVPYEELEVHASNWPVEIIVCWGLLHALGVRETTLEDWHVRLVPALASVLGMIPLFFALRRLLGERFGAVTLGIFAVSPIFAYYATLGWGPGVMGGFAFTCWALWLRAPDARAPWLWRVLALLAGMLATATEWTGCFALAPLFFLELGQGRRGLKRAAAIALSTLAAFAMIAAFLAMHDLIGDSAVSFQSRSRDADQLGAWVSSILAVIRRVAFYTSPPALFIVSAATAVVIRALWNPARGRAAVLGEPVCWFLLGLGAWWLSTFLVLRYAYHVHDYYTWTLCLWVMIAVGAALRAWNRPGMASQRRTTITQVALVLIVCWSGVAFVRRIGQRGGYPLAYELCREVRAHTRFGEEVLTAVPEAAMRNSYSAYMSRSVVQTGVTSLDLVEKARRDRPRVRYRWVVVTTRALAREYLPFTGAFTQDDPLWRDFGILDDDDPFLAALRGRYGAARHGAFLFFDLDSA